MSKRDEKKENKAAFNRFFKSARDALVDLTTLEVNSVIVSSISADYPSNDQELLLQTCRDLTRWFERCNVDCRVQNDLKNQISQLSTLSDKEGACHKWNEKIKPLRKSIDECLDEYEKRVLDASQDYKPAEADYQRHLTYLKRYLELHEKWCVDKDREKDKDSEKDKARSSICICIPGRLFNKDKDKDKAFSDRERQQLRKLWELVDTKYIYAQTVMQLDGDIVSRINDQLFNTKKDRDNAEKLMHLHRWNVEAGANYRNGLIDTLVKIITAVLK